MRLKYLVKTVGAVVLPSVLTALLAIQVFICKNSFDLRNAYLLEGIPPASEKVWDALGGSAYPYILQSVLNTSRQRQGGPDVTFQSGGLPSKEQWQREIIQYRKKYRESVLQDGLPSMTVHFLWCVDGYFELTHYITVLSLLHQFRPDKIVVHYRVKPRADPHGYWRWLRDLERDVVMFSLKPLKNAKYCSHDLSAGVTHEHFSDPHGVFILGDVAITNLTRPDIVEMIKKSFLKGTSLKSLAAISQGELSQSQVFIVPDTEPFHISQSPGRVVLSCPTVTYLNNAPRLNRIHCVSMQSYLSTDELLHMGSKFHKFARMLLYGSAKPVEVKRSPSSPIPKIVHIILEDDKADVSPMLYLSIKSAFRIGGANQVFIHCHRRPEGQFWERLFHHDKLRPKYIFTPSLSKPGSQVTAKTYLLYTLLQHGGIALQGDVIFTKPIGTMALTANAIGGLQKSMYRQKHRSVSTAVLASAPGSDFIKGMLGMVYQPGQSHLVIEMDKIASHLSEVNPSSVLIDSFLVSDQICQGQQCMVAGGHDPPNNAQTTRFLWRDSRQPESLREFAAIEGPIQSIISNLV